MRHYHGELYWNSQKQNNDAAQEEQKVEEKA